MEAQGHFALESAMDELAYATGVDPVALRLLYAVTICWKTSKATSS
jgi:xanthine dehydrogenase YagR molybdenum-binding subunit